MRGAVSIVVTAEWMGAGELDGDDLAVGEGR